MSTVAMASFGTSPGLTTTAVALALHWPAPVMLAEVDVSKPTSVVTGFMQGSMGSAGGLMGVVQSSLQHSVTTQDLWDFAIPLHPTPAQAPAGGTSWLLAGLPTPAAARAMESFWGELLEALGRLEAEGIDALLDVGRADDLHGRTELLTGVDHLLLAVRSDLTSIAALNAHLPAILSAREAAGAPGTVSLVVIEDPAHRIPDREISKFLNLGVSGRIPHAPQAAAWYCGGLAGTTRARRSYDAAVKALAASVQTHLAKRRELMRTAQNQVQTTGGRA